MARCRSHLFFRYLSTHPQVQPFWHPFLPAFLFGPERYTLKTKNARKGEWVAPPVDAGPTYNDATELFLGGIKDAQGKNKIFVANEHCQMILQQEITLSIIRNTRDSLKVESNPTVIPDQIFNSLRPVFIIRNPVFSVPSTYVSFSQGTEVRPGEEDWETIVDLRQQRLIFDQFRHHHGFTPIVVDGDDVVWRTKDLGEALGQALNLDPNGFSNVWDAVPEDRRSKWPVIRHFLTTIDASTGIERTSSTRPDPDLEAAYQKWTGLYGTEMSTALKKTVEENTPHYEYLKQFKI